MKSLVLILKTFTLLSLIGWNTKSSPNKSQVNRKSEETYTKKIDEFITEYYNNDQFNGNVLVVKKDSVLFQKSFGYLSVQQEVELNKNSIFKIGSIAKEFNAVAIMMLQERGLLNIDDPISKYELNLPDWSSKITAKHLLNYTSGLPRIDTVSWLKNDDDAWKVLRESDTLLFEPTSRFLYDNSNIFLQRRIIEKVSGQSYEKFILENIVKPLKMEHSVHVPEEGHPNKTFCYDKDKNPCPKMEFISGWLWVTANDLHKWVKALNENILISQKSFDELLRNPFFKSTASYPNYSTSPSPFGEYFEKSRIHRHNGISYQFESILINDLKNDLVVIVLSNYRNKVWNLGHSIHNILLDKPYKSIYEAIRIRTIQDVDSGIKAYRELKEKHQDLYQFDKPSDLNRLGYELLRMDKKEEAIKIFLLATSEFPNDANLFDSLGEGYFENGQYDLSLFNYKKSLQMNPGNKNGEEMIEKINAILNQ
ncbi:serine hydrolase [Aureibacter tunicatorum]|uniref:CubicO group peptidase (Beta-lactamase class C family) n=1 Tax=Aureibacter tunicatorum TaxID=866807 RepID=A0AAE4BSF7_9BACT|nr:serine hydrolase [Aureibacter tunicatorum]MDR6241194.1 CubicO group peptidase (beta-lactamase class C family) [Aureibacter tunicatorum]BDD03969.1 hypothetical protein AUTU_14520 [Aureibacter tunicatorum]